uniref:hypothetical protein n=1 Tax=Streptomyces sp. F12 TaxID=1436084 RepID=UPI0015E82F33|nr:hypothetical protein [Streptomyces sp. F12]
MPKFSTLSYVAGRLGLAATAAVSAAVVAASPAAAVTYGYGPWYDGLKGAKAYFAKTGDHLKVCDIKSDGEVAQVKVRDETMNAYLYTLKDTYNDGRCHYASAADGGVHNLPEKHWISFTVQTGNYMFDSKKFNIYNDA